MAWYHSTHETRLSNESIVWYGYKYDVKQYAKRKISTEKKDWLLQIK